MVGRNWKIWDLMLLNQFPSYKSQKHSQFNLAQTSRKLSEYKWPTSRVLNWLVLGIWNKHSPRSVCGSGYVAAEINPFMAGVLRYEFQIIFDQI